MIHIVQHALTIQISALPVLALSAISIRLLIALLLFKFITMASTTSLPVCAIKATLTTVVVLIVSPAMLRAITVL